jgi:DNA (cytosine-5)-methyltransferase 1
MRVLSLFSGCGGMDIGIEEGGGDVILSTDIMPETKSTFDKQFPGKDFLLADIRDLEKFPDVDVVVGGYPCQSFSMGGNRAPANDPRTYLYKEFARVVKKVNPKYFIAENVSGLKSVQNGKWLSAQLEIYDDLGKHGYNISWKVLNAQDYGVPQRRKRLFMVGVQKNLKAYYHFPNPTHCKRHFTGKTGLLPFASHGEAIRHLPFDAPGEFYERPHDPEGHLSWYYMSRNRKAKWSEPSFTIVANFRHITLHPACSTMKMLWSNLADGFKQGWDFSGEYEHLDFDPSLPVLKVPRRLTWREAAAIQTFSKGFEVAGTLEKKFEQIGNAVPPLLIKVISEPLFSGKGLKGHPDGTFHSDKTPEPHQIDLFASI